MLAMEAESPNNDGIIPFPHSGRCGHVLDRLIPHSTLLEVERDEGIFAQGDLSQFCYQVVSGCVRSVTLLEDGRRQVGEFLLPGDVFGWEAEDEHDFAAEAVTATTLRRFRLSVIEQRAINDLMFAQQLRHYIAAQVRAGRSHLMLLGRMTAAERIATFLLEMHQRLSVAGGAQAGRVIELPMSRADMADYLGLTIETVCRGLTDLRRCGTITVDRTRVIIHDRRALGRAGSDVMH
jgi:CRP/FNR family nitrogen fixation transcriptional regulator